jgi:hypothetical protein
VCLLNDTRPELPDTGGGCCDGEAFIGPQGCTCWVEVYDLNQADPDPAAVRLLATGVQPSAQPTRCGDCAYRPGSPERTGAAGYLGDADFLDELAARGDQFWCHQGMRRVVELRHPSGVTVPGHPAAYRPPIIAGIPYRADGQPGLLCAGWVARRRRHAALVGAPRH